MPYGAGKYTYELVDGWAKLPEGWSFLDVGGISIDSQDRVYVLNRSDHPVMVFDREGNFLTSWGEGLFKRVHGNGVGPDDSIYCADDKNHTVRKFTPPSDTGYSQEWFEFFWSLTTITKGGPPFNRPTGVALSSSGEIYVSDGYGNARVHKFAPDGKLLLSWGEPGYAPGQFRLPHNIWVDKRDRVWIPDRENSRIQIFNSQGEFLSQWEDVIRPTDICMDGEGIVYISELCLRVSIFTSDGKLLSRLGTEELEVDKALFLAPHAIAVDSRGDLYVGDVSWAHNKIDRGSRTVQKFARKI